MCSEWKDSVLHLIYGPKEPGCIHWLLTVEHQVWGGKILSPGSLWSYRCGGHRHGVGETDGRLVFTSIVSLKFASGL